MAAPASLLLPRPWAQLLYTMVASDARVVMAESMGGRHVSAGDVLPLIVTHVAQFGDVTHVTGSVITPRGVMLPVAGVPLVREPSPGAAHWPMPDESLVATQEERAEPRNDAPLKQASGGVNLDMASPDVRAAALPLGLPEDVARRISAEVAALPSDTGLLRDELLTARRNAAFFRLALESKAEHEARLIKWRDEALKERDEARAEVLRWQADSRRKLAERDEARAALAALQGIGADADELRKMHAKAEAALRAAVDERDASRPGDEHDQLGAGRAG